jgi:glycosyltransferase involved in cell wall biosynthesis
MPRDLPSPSFAAPTRHHIGLLSTFPPKLCGLATYAAALQRELRRAGHVVDSMVIDDGDTVVGAHATATLVNGVPSSAAAVSAALRQCDVAIIQHEYGIYGGRDGDELIELMATLDVPTVVILHTVPLVPTPHQKFVLETVAGMANRAVVMTEAARARLLASYAVDPLTVSTIPHGASAPSHGVHAHATAAAGARPMLLTWGLLGPGKGIEHAIDALALLDPVDRPRYTVAGVTHPKVLARDGDEYRTSLIERARAAGVAGDVVFDDTYRDVPELMRFVASAAAVVLPYDSRDQVTSGVLVDAIAAGRPVIATAFPHAVELLGTGAGIIVPHADVAALADAMRTVVVDTERRRAMEREAHRLAPALSWTRVADTYAGLVARLARSLTPVAR